MQRIIIKMRDKKNSKPYSALNKRGQFYLIAAMIIIVVILSFAAISNYSKRKEYAKLYNLGEELGIESQNILDFGTYNELDETQMAELLENFIQSYIDYAGEEKNLYFIFGNIDSITIVSYQQLTEEVSIDVSGSSPLIISEGGTQTYTFFPTGTKRVVITLNGNEYEFRLKPGENFYFVISQEIGEEQYIITN